MSARIEAWMRPSANKFVRAHAETVSAGPQAWRPSRLLAVSLLCLGFAVALSGFGYKLSGYSLRFNPASHSEFSMLWDNNPDLEHLHPEAAVAIHSDLYLPLNIAAMPPGPTEQRGGLRQPEIPKHAFRVLHSVTALRSPPSGFPPASPPFA
jgi:hypothetical protein